MFYKEKLVSDGEKSVSDFEQFYNHPSPFISNNFLGGICVGSCQTINIFLQPAIRSIVQRVAIGMTGAETKKKTSTIYQIINAFLLILGLYHPFQWSWRDLNPRPNAELMCFLHA